MTTTDTKTSTCGEQVIEQRLDALDRALLGLLPRSERLTMVTQVQSRVRELVTSNPDALSSAANAAEPVSSASAPSRSSSAAGTKRRSGLALSSGILGIMALVMLFAMPITYLFVVTIGEELGELFSYALLGIHILVVALGGLVALIMGISGLVSLARRKGQLVGHGWAITGLCTAPLPTVIGGLMVLSIAFSLVAVRAVETSSSPQIVSSSSYSPGPTNSYGPSEGPYCAPAMPASFPMPMPVSAAPTCPTPTFCTPASTSPVSHPIELQEQISWQTDIAQAVKQAKAEGKMVLIHFYGDSCPPCRAIEQKVFPQPQVVQAILRSYVPVKVNVDTDKEIAAQYAVRAIPTDVFLAGGTGKETCRAISKQSPVEYARLLDVCAMQSEPPTACATPASAPTSPYGSTPTVPTEPNNRYSSSLAPAPAPATAATAPSSVGPYGTAAAAPATLDTPAPQPPKP